MTELTKEHIKKLVTHFYKKVQEDELLSPIFNDIAKVDWTHHIPLICQFWNSIMIKTQEYQGNVYIKHVFLGKKTKIQDIHFSRWLLLFQQDAKKHLPESAAHEIGQRASLIARSLKLGMTNEENKD